jgi:hypothetical protein
MDKNYKQEIYLCQCENLGHVVHLGYFPGDGVYLSTSVYQYKSFWERLKAAVRFLFMKNQTAEFDSTMLSDEDASRMRDFLDSYIETI